MIIRQPSFHSYLIISLAFFALFSIVALLPGRNTSLSRIYNFQKEPKWLLAVFLSPQAYTRRAIIRSTWATRFSHLSYEYRFIIGNYSASKWAPLIDHENRTYGDIWSIPEFVNENGHTANRIKNMEFFKHMVEQERKGGRRYEFVSKVDDDNWFNIPPFYDMFIAPRLPGGAEYNASALTVIGRPMVWSQPFVYASGRLYTLSWPVVEFLAHKYVQDGPEKVAQRDKTEDELMGVYLWEERVEHVFVPVELEQAWDIGLESVVSDTTMLIHGVKNDERLLEISEIFDGKGRWNGKVVEGLTGFNRTMKEVEERLGAPAMMQMVDLRAEWDKVSGTGVGGWEGLDWRLIEEKISIEDREAMGRMWPLTLPGNNVSRGVVPQKLGRTKRPG